MRCRVGFLLATAIRATAIAGVALAVVPDSDHARADGAITVDAGTNYFCGPSYEGGVCATSVVAPTTLTWDIVDGIHTVTQCGASFDDCPPAGGFDSGILPEGNSFSWTFETPGSYNYVCTLHADAMRGVISVLEPAPSPTLAPTPTPGQNASPVPTASPDPSVATTPVAFPVAGGNPGVETTGLPSTLGFAAGLLLMAFGAATVTGCRSRS